MKIAKGSIVINFSQAVARQSIDEFIEKKLAKGLDAF